MIFGTSTFADAGYGDMPPVRRAPCIAVTYAAVAFAVAAFAGEVCPPEGPPPRPCLTGAYADFTFGSVPFAGDNCPPVVIPPEPIPPKPPTGGHRPGGKPKIKRLRLREVREEQRQEQKQEERFRENFETDDEECILAVITAFTTHAHAQQMSR